mgnify:CR=1 FL=1
MLRKIFKWLPTSTCKTVIHALVTSKLHYWNTLYARIIEQLARRLQTIQNVAARITLNLPRRAHITPHLKELHWLPIHKQAQFKLLIQTYKTLHNTGPDYPIDASHFTNHRDTSA